MEGTLGSAGQRRIPARYVLFGVVAVVLIFGAVSAPGAKSSRPTRDDDVIATLPARNTAEARELAQLRRRAAEAPLDLEKALALAQRYIESARRTADPRDLGAAEATLAAWTKQTDPPSAVRLLRATILQSRHDFDAALIDLDSVLKETPDDAQALLTRATVWTVKGNYDEARKSCTQLAPLVSHAYAVACTAPLDMLTGAGDRAGAALAGALSTSRSPAERSLLHSIAGEQAYWLGAMAEGERHLRAALQLDPDDRYSRAVYADLLLDAARYDEARALLAAHETDDALALRLALVDLARGVHDGSAERRVADNFAASRLRGDAVHRREEARLWLARGDAQKALRCALESFRVQREPWDARLVLESAQAARRPEAAGDVVAWLDAHHFAAPQMRAREANLRGRP